MDDMASIEANRELVNACTAALTVDQAAELRGRPCPSCGVRICGIADWMREDRMAGIFHDLRYGPAELAGV